jgi:hypothetical protein
LPPKNIKTEIYKTDFLFLHGFETWSVTETVGKEDRLSVSERIILRGVHLDARGRKGQNTGVKLQSEEIRNFPLSPRMIMHSR